MLTKLIPGLIPKSKTSNRSIGDRLQGTTFVLTGTLPTITREQAAKLIQENGGRVTNSISKKTTYVLTGDNAGNKLDKAQTLSIKIISEGDLLDMLTLG